MSAPGDPPPQERTKQTQTKQAARSHFHWWFQHRRTGDLVFAQWPNLPLWIFIVLFAWQIILQPTGHLLTAIIVVAAICLTWWGADELIRGANPWRRLLGAGVLAFQVYHFWPLLAGLVH